MADFDFDKERRRLLRMLKAHGLQSVEDLLLSMGLAVLDLTDKRPGNKKGYHKYHDTLSQARMELRRARILNGIN